MTSGRRGIKDNKGKNGILPRVVSWKELAITHGTEEGRAG